MNETKTHGVKIGDMFVLSYGYDQTNVHYFQVVSITAKGVYVREIGANFVEGTQGRDCSDVSLAKDQFLSRSQWCGGFNSQNEPTFRRIQFSGGRNGSPEEPYFNFKGRYFARPVSENESTYCSWYA